MGGPLATATENRYIKPFNPIPEREVIRRFQFAPFEEVESTIKRYMDFYNNKRLHPALWYTTQKR